MKWEKIEEDALPIRSWCEEVEAGALVQARNLAHHPALAHHVALMPDCHCGYGMPIGGVVAAKNAVIPSAVGVDIGCGMIAVETDVPAERLAEMRFRRAIQMKVKTLIPVGEGASHKAKQEWEGFEEYLDKGGAAQFAASLDRHNLGTLGGGNHFIEIQKSDAGFVWLMIHSGSRNLGKRVEEFYHERAAKLDAKYFVPLPDPDLAFLPIGEADGHNYFRDMNFALRYARENRRRMMEVLKTVFRSSFPGRSSCGRSTSTTTTRRSRSTSARRCASTARGRPAPSSTRSGSSPARWAPRAISCAASATPSRS